MDMSVAPFVKLNPDVHTIPCKDIVLLGRNFKSADFRSDNPTDSVMTGAFVPFGTATSVGQIIPGAKKCGGSILKFDPNNAEATIAMHAWGFRNLIGIGWDKNGKMYGTENGYDVRGSRPVNDNIDVSLRINEGVWYGVPDFSAGREPVTNAKFEVPDEFEAEAFVGNTSLGKNLGFVIDHAASGLTPPTPAVVLSRHEINSSPCLFDIAPDSWGALAGQLFIAEWGDLAPPTNPLRGNVPAKGYRVVKVNPNTGDLIPFVSNTGGIPASSQGKTGEGLERPFDVKFGPDGAMYIVDYGVVKIDMSKKPPYDAKAGTGTIWKVTKVTKK
jgi:glucose/arabinose dehydrogenase